MPEPVGWRLRAKRTRPGDREPSWSITRPRTPCVAERSPTRMLACSGPVLLVGPSSPSQKGGAWAGPAPADRRHDRSASIGTAGDTSPTAFTISVDTTPSAHHQHHRSTSTCPTELLSSPPSRPVASARPRYLALRHGRHAVRQHGDLLSAGQETSCPSMRRSCCPLTASTLG